jgi:hypothetical protein
MKIIEVVGKELSSAQDAIQKMQNIFGQIPIAT